MIKARIASLILASAIMLLLPPTAVTAQTVVSPPQATIPNPLRGIQPAPVAQPKATQPVAATAPATATPEAAKPKRERSAKQKQGDDDMRTCGASWKTDKVALTAKGETWRSYLKTCRGGLKASRG